MVLWGLRVQHMNWGTGTSQSTMSVPVRKAGNLVPYPHGSILHLCSQIIPFHVLTKMAQFAQFHWPFWHLSSWGVGDCFLEHCPWRQSHCQAAHPWIPSLTAPPLMAAPSSAKTHPEAQLKRVVVLSKKPGVVHWPQSPGYSIPEDNVSSWAWTSCGVYN